MINKKQAIRSLIPSAQFVVFDNDRVEWLSPGMPQPTQAEVDTETARLQAESDAQEYARNRQAEYPSLDELVVAMWEGVVEERMASVTTLEGLRQAIKTKYPK